MSTQSSTEGTSVPAGAQQDPQPSSALPAGARAGRGVVALALAGVLLGAGAVALLVARAPRESAVTPEPAATSTSVPVPPGGSVAPVETPSRVRSSGPKWVGGAETLGRRTRVRYFELAADNEIAIWNRRVRPVLSVRCVGDSTEAYVLTASAAAMEDARGSHTVSLAFDNGAPQKQSWFPSDDYQALFAPDAVAFARQVASASTLRFAFTPYGAGPAMAEFDTRGFDALIGQIARSCRWKP